MVLVVPAITDRATVAAAAVAGVAAVLGAELPYNAGLITAAVLGIAAGRSVEARLR